VLTSKTISRAIEEKYGIPGVMVFCGGGMCRFYSDTNNDAAELISKSYSGVGVCRINHLTLDQWLDEFNDILGGDNEYK